MLGAIGGSDTGSDSYSHQPQQQYSSQGYSSELDTNAIISAIAGGDSHSSVSQGYSDQSNPISFQAFEAQGVHPPSITTIHTGGDAQSQSYAAQAQTYSAPSHSYSEPSQSISFQAFEAQGVSPPAITTIHTSGGYSQPASSGWQPASYATGHNNYNTIGSQNLVTETGHDSYQGVDSYNAPPSGNIPCLIFGSFFANK